MNKALNINRQVILFGIPFFMIFAMLLLAKSSAFVANPDTLSIGITIDLLLTIPLVYFLLIRKTKIPKTTVVPVMVIGLFIGSNILPLENQYYLNIFKIWALPVIELSVLGLITYKFRAVINEYTSKKEATLDFYTALKEASRSIFPSKIAILFSTEIAVIYYGFVLWRKRKLAACEFTYHKGSSAISLLAVLIFIVAIETFVFHILLERWSTTAAWILTGLSIYTAIQVFAIIKSIVKRPISVEESSLKLRYGILNETSINYIDIESIESYTASINEEDNIKKLSSLGELESHNILIILKKDYTLHGLYGTKKQYRKIAFYVDEKDTFITQVVKEINRQLKV